MKKKIIALLMLLMITLTSVLPAYASLNDDINKVIQKMESISSSERQSYIILLAPMFMVDSGIDNLIGYVKNYDESKINEGYINVYIKKLLNYTDKETVINLLESIKCTDIEARQQLITAIRYKNPLTISESSKEGLSAFLDATYNKYPDLEKILNEDGYNEEIIANVLFCLFKINGGNPFYVYEKNNNEFKGGTIDENLKEKLDNIWKSENSTQITLDFEEVLNLSAQKLNNNIPESERNKIAEALSEVGIAKIVTQDSAGTDSSKKSDIEVNIELKEGETKIFTFETTMKRPVLYKKEGDNLKVVKYAVSEDGNIVAKLKEAGTYLIKESPDKFKDCDGWAKEYIETLAARGIINGKAEGLYMPGDLIKREEFVKLITELMDIEPNSAENIFEDVKKDAWYAGFINSAYENKIINGISENEFGVGQNIKRQDIAKIINTVLMVDGITSEVKETDLADFDKIADYAKEHVSSIYSMGIISGDDKKMFNPESFATRAEAAKMIYGMLVQIVKK